MSYKNL